MEAGFREGEEETERKKETHIFRATALRVGESRLDFQIALNLRMQQKGV